MFIIFFIHRISLFAQANRQWRRQSLSAFPDFQILNSYQVARISISLYNFNPLLGWYIIITKTSHSPKWIRIITWGIIKTNIMIVRVINLLEWYATTASLCWCTWGIIKIEAFLEGLFAIEGQSQWDPHQNYCWCDALAKWMLSVKQKSRNKQNL